MSAVLNRMRNGLVVSCQPLPGGPLDNVDSIVRQALAARDGGARALRIEGLENVRAVAAACDLPIVGIVKRDLDTSPVRITPLVEDVQGLAEAGAAVIAVDATDRVRPVEIHDLCAAIRRAGRLAMADVSNITEAEQAAAMQFDILGTTLSGYTTGTGIPAAPDVQLVRDCARLGRFVTAEGRFNSPLLAQQAMAAGADAVCVGSALTRLEHVTGWFCDAVRRGVAERCNVVLAYDIGGTKSLAALVRGAEVLERRTISTTGADVGSADWLRMLTDLATDWPSRAQRAALAVTGTIHDGVWRGLNPKTLAIPPDFRLGEELARRLGLPVTAANDAQAAAWGEYRHGAGAGRDMLFITVSSGIGGGAVVDGKLLVGRGGVAGSIGQLGVFRRLEDRASGFAIARAAGAAGRPADTRAVFADAAAGQHYAVEIVTDAARELAAGLADTQVLLDPEVVVIGGGVGLLPLFQAALERAIADLPAYARPALAPAQLGADAGVIGAAALPC